MDIGQGVGGYGVDFVVCIDATPSMKENLENVKAFAMNFCQTFVKEMGAEGKDIEKLRIKVIAFGDYKYDAEPMKVSDFFVLPNQAEELKAFVENIKANEHRDDEGAANALEAISIAMKSDWTTEGNQQRHIILVFSDAPALELGARADCPGYPTDLPKSLAELGAWWEDCDQTFSSSTTFNEKASRLIAFVPYTYPWSDMQAWNRYWPAFSTKAGIDLTDVDIYCAIDLMAARIR